MAKVKMEIPRSEWLTFVKASKDSGLSLEEAIFRALRSWVSESEKDKSVFDDNRAKFKLMRVDE